MTKIVFERCQKVIDIYNDIYCRNIEGILFKMNKLRNSQEGGFTVWLDVKRHLTEICRVEAIPINPALVEIQVNELFFPELLLTADDSVICDSAIAHLVLDRILCTDMINIIFNDQCAKFRHGGEL